jgi:hypothetical protein
LEEKNAELCKLEAFAASIFIYTVSHLSSERASFAEGHSVSGENIVDDPDALAELKKVGYMTTPVIVIDGSMIVGLCGCGRLAQLEDRHDRITPKKSFVEIYDVAYISIVDCRNKDGLPMRDSRERIVLRALIFSSQEDQLDSFFNNRQVVSLSSGHSCVNSSYVRRPPFDLQPAPGSSHPVV